MFTIPDLMASGYYAMLGLIMPLVYVVITANSLVALQIDRGSMAYTLSTPITRVRVVFTQAAYLIVALLAMFTVVTASGLAVSQISHNALWGQNYTADVMATSEVLELSPDEVSNNIRFILDSPEAMTTGAGARGVSEEVYFLYLELLMINTALNEIANDIGVTPDEILTTPILIEESQNAPMIISQVFGIGIDYVLGHVDSIAELEGQSIPSTTAILVMAHGLDDYMQDIEMETLMVGVYAAAEYLDMEATQLLTQLHIVENDPNVLAIASEASGVAEESLMAFIRVQQAELEYEFDQDIYFNVGSYINLNIGIFLLMFAIGGVSFMFSCIFNLSRNSLALGAGIPFAFFILNMMASISPDFASLRYLTLNTLYNPMNVVGGYDFIPQFIAMTVIGLTLYIIGIAVFKKKDLPL
jgi:ABC-2 type transport system permease protein